MDWSVISPWTFVEKVLCENKKRLQGIKSANNFILGLDSENSSIYRMSKSDLFERQLVPLILEFVYNDLEFKKMLVNIKNHFSNGSV